MANVLRHRKFSTTNGIVTYVRFLQLLWQLKEVFKRMAETTASCRVENCDLVNLRQNDFSVTQYFLRKFFLKN